MDSNFGCRLLQFATAITGSVALIFILLFLDMGRSTLFSIGILGFKSLATLVTTGILSVVSIELISLGVSARHIGLYH